MTKQHYKASTYRAQTSIGYLMKRGHSLWTECLEPLLERQGFSFLQYVILKLLRDGIARYPGDICRLYRHDSGALTRVIDQLAERGLVERLRREQDRRKVELQLTPAGHKAIDAVVPSVVEALNLVLDDFSVPEIQEFTRLLMKLTGRLQATIDLKVAADPALQES